MNLHRNYPLYEVEPMTDFRSMIERSAEKYRERVAISYRKKPTDAEAIRKTYPELRDNVVGLGTSLIHMGCRDKKVAIIGENSYGWALSYLATLAIGAVNIPVDKELPVADMAGILNTAGCQVVLYGHIDGKIAEVQKLVPSIESLVAFEASGIEGARTIPALIEEGHALTTSARSIRKTLPPSCSPLVLRARERALCFLSITFAPISIRRSIP